MGMMGGIFLIPIFDQIFLGFDATETGLQFLPMAFCMILAAPLGASLVGKVQPRYVIAVSTFVAAIGMYLFMGLDVRSGTWDIVIPMSVMAFGMGFAMAQRTGIIAAIVPHEDIGSASAVLALVRNIAGAFGIAVFTTLLNDSTENNMLAISAHTVVNIHTPAVLQLASGLMYLDAQILAYRTVFFVSAIFLLAAAALALLIDVEETVGGEDIILES
jgi:hypothetical protein